MNAPVPKVDILLAGASVGAGHNQAALAVQAALRLAAPQVTTEFTDTLQHVQGWFRLMYRGGYNFMVGRLPWLYGFGYWLMDLPKGPRRGLGERLRLAQEWLALKPFRRRLLASPPKIVVCTHYLAMPMIGRMIRQAAPLRLMCVVTDNEAHRWWYSQNVERYFVPNEQVKAELLTWGVRADAVLVTGIPVHPKWTMPLERQKVLTDWKLPGDRPIVILSGGTYFTVGPVEQIARGILDNSEAFIVVLAGNNKRLQADFARFPEAGERIIAVGFTQQVHELAEVCACMVTKAGGLITSECIAKGVPMVLTRSVPGQEAANARMLEAAGAAVRAFKALDVSAQVVRLLKDPTAAQAMRQNAHRLCKPAGELIAQELLRLLPQK